MAWTSRVFSRAEAAELTGLHPSMLDVVTHRARPLAVLFSERRKGRRWFSPKDIAVLRLGYELERAGRNWATALAQAFEHLGQPPPPDAVLIVPVMSVAHTSGRVATGLPALPCAASMIVLPIGQIASNIQAACGQLEAQNVAA